MEESHVIQMLSNGRKIGHFQGVQMPSGAFLSRGFSPHVGNFLPRVFSPLGHCYCSPVAISFRNDGFYEMVM